jgi:hypothetical protein
MQQLDASEWVDRCSKRLQAHWRTVEPAQLDEVAGDLWGNSHWRAMLPEAAAIEWLNQGVLANA